MRLMEQARRRGKWASLSSIELFLVRQYLITPLVECFAGFPSERSPTVSPRNALSSYTAFEMWHLLDHEWNPEGIVLLMICFYLGRIAQTLLGLSNARCDGNPFLD